MWSSVPTSDACGRIMSPLRIVIVGFGKIARDQATEGAEAEYIGLYRRFVELTATGALDVDLAPFQLVADAFMLGRRRTVEPFEDAP
jgi:hypothetical protein